MNPGLTEYSFEKTTVWVEGLNKDVFVKFITTVILDIHCEAYLN